MASNLMLWDEPNESQQTISVARGSAARCWCDPMSFDDVVGVDLGAKRMHLYSTSRSRAWSVNSTDGLKEILLLPPNTLVVAEWAHLATPRNARSLSQPFSAEELLMFFSTAHEQRITIKLAPHYHTGIRFRGWAANNFPFLQLADKGDAEDAMAIALHVLHLNDVSLANPPASFAQDKKREYGKCVREYAHVFLNAERNARYKGDFFPDVIDLGQRIERKRGKRLGALACYSIASLIATEINGRPFMFVRNGTPPGVEMWWRHVARMTPFHHQGGIARSNLMRHSFRSYLRRSAARAGVKMGPDKNKLFPFGQHDAQQSSARTVAMKTFRDLSKECYRVGVSLAQDLEFGLLDPVKTPWGDDKHGR